MVNTGIKMNNIGEYLKVFVIDVVEEEMGAIDMPNTLKDMKRITHASCIEIGDISIEDNKYKTIYSSDVSDKMHISCADKNGKTVYKGNIIIVAYETDDKGNETLCSLTDAEINQLMSNTGLMFISNKDGTKYNAYVLCNVKVEN